ncbi:MAG: restriction endonuclease subunit S, partial [Bacteroidales bacterium]
VRLLILKPQNTVDLIFYENYINKINIHQESTGVPQLTAPQISKYKIAVPPLPEQQKIAAILSTWDTAISKTKQLINKLKERNRGLQQQLLTGKKRINGFEETRWVKITADSIFKSISTKNNNGNEQLLSVTQDRGAIPRDMLEGRVTMPSGDTNSFKLVEPGDFIISLRSFQGGLEYSEYRGLVSPAYTVLKPIKPIDHDFYKYYFKSYDFIGHLAIAVIGIRDGKQISFDDFCTVKLPNPSKDEQTKIAEVLSAAGNEVKIQEKKLEALKQQKKGLMQKLLTGKIRVNSKI